LADVVAGAFQMFGEGLAERDVVVDDQDAGDGGLQRRRSESNRRIEVLQTSALPLGYGAGET
jgi:hypothetical protein